MFYTANQTIFSLDINGVEDSEGTKLQVLAFDGIEAVNSEYIFEITLVSKHLRYDITKLLSKSAYLSFTPDKKQGIHGVILSVKRAAIGNDYSLFKLILAPKFYHLYNEVDQRAFVNQSVPEIISTVLSEKGYQQGDNMDFVFKFKEDYPKREFCCQYEETTAHFIHRLCEEEGINIFYQHSQNNHCMVLIDDNNYFPNLDNNFTYASDTGFVADHPVFKRFDVNLHSSTTEASYRNYNFENMKIPEGNAKGEQSNKANNAQEPSLEYYDYPQQHMNKARGDHYSKIQIERLKSFHVTAEGYTDIPELKSGYCFEIEGYPSLDSLDSADKWLTVQIYHQGRQPQVIEALGSEASAVQNTPSQLHKYYRHPINEGIQFPFDEEFKQGYRNVLVGTPKKTPHRPEALHPKSHVLGSQTAIVTGAAGEEIYCDEYGRIKILFHWDRINPQNENSSHWIRVASNWAHDGYGAVVIPRVGMEVKVDFLEGDIDNPIVTGAIHNGVNKVPYDLPANKTRSVFKTSSSKGGVGSNELRIEDKAGQEQIFVQSQKDFDQLTKHNHTVQVNNDSHLQVNNEHSETIKANRYQHQLAEEHHLTDLDRKTQVLMNDYKTVGLSEHNTIGTVKTTQAGMEIHLKSGLQTVVDGGLSLTLKAGGQHIVLNPAGIWMTMPVWTGGIPMEGTPAMPMPPLSKAGSVAATSAPVPRPLTAVQTQTMASDAPFCLECMLNAMGICATDFSNKATPDAVLNTNSLNSSLGTPSFAGGLTDGLSSSMGNLTSMADMSSMANMANLPSSGLGSATSGITGGIANGSIAGSTLTGATPSFMGSESSPLSGISESLGSTTNTLQGLTKDPTQAIQQQATKAATDTAMQAINSNETLKTATETVQQGADLANKAKQTQETLSNATTAATTLKTPDISSTTIGFNPNGGNNV
ncbi:type VI secretion system tip protein VgrG [Gammaproteobacteria bacterium ESL0073]|nr:type VI secretion system tip protein VgrG [Gammaproteobacteria bacterium ESL0073]